MSNPVEEVLSTNAAFYEALATGDFGLMQKVWSNTDDVTCIHPGWGSIFGRQSVMRSWETILQSPPQIACTEPRGFVSGDSAYVIAYENLGDGRLIAVVDWPDTVSECIEDNNAINLGQWPCD